MYKLLISLIYTALISLIYTEYNLQQLTSVDVFFAPSNLDFKQLFPVRSRTKTCSHHDRLLCGLVLVVRREMI